MPEELNQLENAIRAEIEKIGLVIKEIRDIHYGKKVAAAHGIEFGEVNIFFGKRGFSVVRSPKSGSDSKLCGILEMIIWKVLSEFKHPMLPLNEDIFHIQN